MSEKPDQSTWERELRSRMEAGLRLHREDLADPIRRGVMELAQGVALEAIRGMVGNSVLWQDWENLRTRFEKQFANKEIALQYRLYHHIIGSTPPGEATFFDSEGENSLTHGIQELAEKYRIGPKAL